MEEIVNYILEVFGFTSIDEIKPRRNTVKHRNVSRARMVIAKVLSEKKYEKKDIIPYLHTPDISLVYYLRQKCRNYYKTDELLVIGHDKVVEKFEGVENNVVQRLRICRKCRIGKNYKTDFSRNDSGVIHFNCNECLNNRTKPPTHRCCLNCNITKPSTEYYQTSRRCNKCREAYTPYTTNEYGKSHRIKKKCMRCKETKITAENFTFNVEKNSYSNNCDPCCVIIEGNKNKTLLKCNTCKEHKDKSNYKKYDNGKYFQKCADCRNIVRITRSGAKKKPPGTTVAEIKKAEVLARREARIALREENSKNITKRNRAKKEERNKNNTKVEDMILRQQEIKKQQEIGIKNKTLKHVALPNSIRCWVVRETKQN